MTMHSSVHTLPVKKNTSSRPEHVLCLNAAEGLLHLILARIEPAGCGTGGPTGCGPLAPAGPPSSAPAGDAPAAIAPAAPVSLTLLCAQTWHAPSQGAELLAPALTGALARHKLTVRDIRRIACVRGPGSFTGLRLALATAAGLSRTTGALQAGIDYLPLLAHSAFRRLDGVLACGDGQAGKPFPARPRTFWVLTHARKQLIHMQGFRLPAPRQAGGLSAFVPPAPFTEIQVCSPQEAALIVLAHWAEEEKATGADNRPLLLGSGLSRNREALVEFFAASPMTHVDPIRMPLLLPPDYDHPLPEAVLDFAAWIAYSAKDIEPFYVRGADAEENLDRIAQSLGIDPDKARARLAEITHSVG